MSLPVAAQLSPSRKRQLLAAAGYHAMPSHPVLKARREREQRMKAVRS